MKEPVDNGARIHGFGEDPGKHVVADGVPSTNHRHKVGRDFLFLALLSLAFFGFRLGSAPLANPDEARYAEVPREMLASGDWVTPRLNGVNYFEKPPLVYWVIAASMKVFGLNEWAVRAVPALFAFGGVLLTYATARKLYGRAAGLAAGAVLATALLYFTLARIVLLDMAVSVLMSAALFCFILAVREESGVRRRGLFYAVYASMALATLTKGLIGLLVTGAVMLLWLVVCNEWRRLRPLYLPTGALLYLALAAPWHLLAAFRNETWAHRYFVYEHWERFSSTVASRPGPWWYFIPIALLGLFPWTGFLWPALRWNLRGGWGVRRQNTEAWFFFIWAGFIFLFFSKSHSKLPPYILPIFPPLAVLIGRHLAEFWHTSAFSFRTGIKAFAAICLLLALALTYVVLRPGIIRVPEQASLLKPYAYALTAVTFGGAAVTLIMLRLRGPRPALVAMAAIVALFYGGLVLAVPDIQRPSTRELALIVAARASPLDRVTNYHTFCQDFTFYARRTVDVVSERGDSAKGELELEEDPAARASGRFMEEADFRHLWTGSPRVWVLAEKQAVRKLFADPTFRYHLLGETRSHLLFSNQP